VYSLGVMLYEMLTGQRPFRGSETSTEKSGATVNERIRYGHLHLPAPDPRQLESTIPEELAKAVLKALSKNPTDRYASAPQFFAAVCKSVDIDPSSIKDIVFLSEFAEKRDYTIGHEVIKGVAPQVDKPQSNRLPVLIGGLVTVGILGCVVVAVVGGLIFMRGNTKPFDAVTGPDAPFPITQVMSLPTSTRFPTQPANKPDYAVRTAEASLTQAAVVPIIQPTNKPKASSIRACSSVSKPIPVHQGPGANTPIITWLDTSSKGEGCILFDARDSSGTWLRIEANQKGIAYYGNYWVFVNNLSVSVDQVNSLPSVSP
jgi:serine/threonine protein kinase